MKRFALTMVLAAMSLSLAACGGKSSAKSSTKKSINFVESTDAADTKADKEEKSDKSAEKEVEKKLEKVAEIAENAGKESAAVTRKLSQREAETAMNEMVDHLETYRMVFLDDGKVEYKTDAIGDSYDMVMDIYHMTRAAAFSTKVRTGESYSYTSELDRWYLNEDDIESECRNLFGFKADFTTLPAEGNTFYDIVLDHGKPAMDIPIYDNETDNVLISGRVLDRAEGYALEQEIYHGYWGIAKLHKPNFRITYVFEENPASAYGLILTGMHAERIDDESTWNRDQEIYVHGSDYGNEYNNDDGYTVSYGTPFYGIWVSGSKKENAAIEEADRLSKKGFPSQVFLTTDWENLNTEPFYVVTAGVYGSEADAKAALASVKAAGYSDAYVKYSGYHR